MNIFSSDPLEKAKAEIHHDGRFDVMLNEVKNIYDLLDTFIFGQFGNDILFMRSFKAITPAIILHSTHKTLLSIRLCCEHGNFSDANILLRKYRDDLFFYLYIILVIQDAKELFSSELNKHDKNIEAWTKNSMSNVYITDILKYIGGHPMLKLAVQKYNLRTTFDQIGNVLNTYTHGNGKKYYNKVLHTYGEENIEDFTRTFSKHLNYITVTFMFLISLIYPLSIMASDYIDCLENEQEPPLDSQYWVASYIQRYFYEKKDLLGKDCIEYLQEETGMNFSSF